MRQWMRLFIRPWTFFNQLQWSQHHYRILFFFFVLSWIQGMVYGYERWSLLATRYAASFLGIKAEFAFVGVLFFRSAVMVLGLWGISWVAFFLGSFIGERGSFRVLFRRLAIVFSIYLVALIVEKSSWVGSSELRYWLGMGFRLWSLVLGFFALYEHFHLEWASALLVMITLLVTLGAFKKVSVDLTTRYLVAKVYSHSYGKGISRIRRR